MKPKFIGNIGTKTLHVIDFADGRCRIDQIRTERKIEFSTLEEALAYPADGSPIFHKCGICFPKMQKAER